MLSAVKLVNKYSGRFDELEQRFNVSYMKLEKSIDMLLADLALEVAETAKEAVELGFLELDLKTLILVLEKVSDTCYRRAKMILREFPKSFLRELGKELKLAVKSFDEGIDVVLKIVHITYLARGCEDLYNRNVLIYACKLALKSKLRSAPLFVLTATAKYLKTGDVITAHALAAYGVRDVLPLPYHLSEEPWEKPDTWATLLQLSYDYEVGTKISGELLAEWGFLEAITGEEFE